MEVTKFTKVESQAEPTILPTPEKKNMKYYRRESLCGQLKELRKTRSHGKRLFVRKSDSSRDLINSCLKAQKTLKVLAVDSDIDLKRMPASIQSIQTLRVTQDIDQNRIQSLAMKTAPFKQLKELELKFEHCSRINDKGFIMFISRLKESFKGLSSLKLIFEECEKLTNKSVEFFTGLIQRRIPPLESLYLDFFRNTKITEEAVIELSRQIGQHQQPLQFLTLDFGELEKLKENAFRTLVCEIGRNLKSLRSLSLSFFDCDNAGVDQFLKCFARQIGTISSLEKLYLNCFGWNKISNDGFKTFAKQIGNNLQGLRILSLDLTLWRNITNEGFEVFAKELGRIKTLEALGQDFNSFEKITDTAIQTFVKNCGQNLSRLKTLELLLNGCNGLADEGLRHLASLFESIPQLEVFTFSMALNGKITNEGVKSLIASIGRNLVHLQELGLKFRRCQNIGNEAVQAIPEILGRNQRFLCYLSLSFFGCSKITNEGVSPLLIQVLSWKELKTIQFEFGNCSLSNEMLEAIRFMQENFRKSWVSNLHEAIIHNNPII